MNPSRVRHPLSEAGVDDSPHDLAKLTVTELIAPDSCEPTGRRLKQCRTRPADGNRAVRRLGQRQVEVTEPLGGPASCQLTRSGGLIGLTEDADRQRIALAAVEERVPHEPWLRRELIRELGIDEGT